MRGGPEAGAVNWIVLGIGCAVLLVIAVVAGLLVAGGWIYYVTKPEPSSFTPPPVESSAPSTPSSPVSTNDLSAYVGPWMDETSTELDEHIVILRREGNRIVGEIVNENGSITLEAAPGGGLEGTAEIPGETSVRVTAKLSPDGQTLTLTAYPSGQPPDTVRMMRMATE